MNFNFFSLRSFYITVKRKKNSAGIYAKNEAFLLTFTSHLWCKLYTLICFAQKPLMYVTFTLTCVWKRRRSFATIKTPSLNLNNIWDFSPNENFRLRNFQHKIQIIEHKTIRRHTSKDNSARRLQVSNSLAKPEEAKKSFKAMARNKKKQERR